MRLQVREESIREFEIDTEDLEEAKRMLLADQYQPGSVFEALGVENDESWKKTLLGYPFDETRPVKDVSHDPRPTFKSVKVCDPNGWPLSEELMK